MARILHSGVVDVNATAKIHNSNSSVSSAAEYVCIAEESCGAQGDLQSYVQRFLNMVSILRL